MSIKVMSAVWEIEGIDSSECLVMMALADHADDSGRCYPSIARLAKRTKLSDRGVQKVITRLIEKGYVTVSPSAGQGGANLYTVTATPEPRSPLNDVHPRTTGTTPPNHVRKTPEPRSPKPSRTIIEPSESNGARDALLAVLSPEAADAFIDHRKAKRAKLTVKAAQLIAKDLTHHPNPDAVVEASIKNGWTGVFPEKFGGHRDQSPQQNRQSAADDRFGRIADAAVRNRAPSRPDFGFG